MGRHQGHHVQTRLPEAARSRYRLGVSKFVSLPSPPYEHHFDFFSTVYKSPQKDMGYDISDYEDIDPRYGTIADVDNLIAELKKRDMKLMMDLVVNHTSDEVRRPC